jgi:hypothetical protein
VYVSDNSKSSGSDSGDSGRQHRTPLPLSGLLNHHSSHPHSRAPLLPLNAAMVPPQAEVKAIAIRVLSPKPTSPGRTFSSLMVSSTSSTAFSSTSDTTTLAASSAYASTGHPVSGGLGPVSVSVTTKLPARAEVLR